MTPDFGDFLAISVIGSCLLVGSLVSAGLLFLRTRLAPSDLAAQRLTGAIAGIVIGWLGVALWLSQAGVFRATVDGPLVPAISYGIAVPIIVGLRFVVSSRPFGRILDAVPQHWIVGVQLYRVLGVIFLVSYANGLLPGVFALPADWGDTVVGLTAPLAAYLLLKDGRTARGSVLIWNMVGIADLVMAIGLGFLSSPGRFQVLSHEAPNQIISAYPLVMVPVFAVPLSILLHVCSLRKLARGKTDAEMDRPMAAVS